MTCADFYNITSVQTSATWPVQTSATGPLYRHLQHDLCTDSCNMLLELKGDCKIQVVFCWFAARPKKSSVVSGSSNSSTAKSVLSPERSRPRGRMGVSQSQRQYPAVSLHPPSIFVPLFFNIMSCGDFVASSRSGSPSSRAAYLTYIQQQQPSSTTAAMQRSARKSAIPRSQGASREASPSRTYGKSLYGKSPCGQSSLW